MLPVLFATPPSPENIHLQVWAVHFQGQTEPYLKENHLLDEFCCEIGFL